MTKEEIKDELDRLGIEYPKKALKKDLEALLAGVDEAEAAVEEKVEAAVQDIHEPAWIPSWVLDERRQSLPAWAPFERVVHESKPKRPPVGGGSWVHTELPQWLKQ
jgi:hypothetical protein